MSTWKIPGTWPVGDPVDPEAVAVVVAEFDRWHPVSVAQLAEVEIPAVTVTEWEEAR